MPSTWSKWPCVNRSRSSLRKPAPLRSNWRWMPSPQSTGYGRCPLRRGGRGGCVLQMERLPTSLEMSGRTWLEEPLLSTSGDGPRSPISAWMVRPPPSASSAGNGRMYMYELPVGLSVVIGQVRSRRSSSRTGPAPSRKRICRRVRGRPRARRQQRLRMKDLRRWPQAGGSGCRGASRPASPRLVRALLSARPISSPGWSRRRP